MTTMAKIALMFVVFVDLIGQGLVFPIINSLIMDPSSGFLPAGTTMDARHLARMPRLTAAPGETAQHLHTTTTPSLVSDRATAWRAGGPTQRSVPTDCSRQESTIGRGSRDCRGMDHGSADLACGQCVA